MIEDDRLEHVRQQLELDARPSILISPDYEVIAANEAYRRAFGTGVVKRRCYEVSHGFDGPCDQHGETCPLARARKTRASARVLHVHRTPRGPEHVDVLLRPVLAEDGTLAGFIEHLEQVEEASASPRVGAQIGVSRAFNQALELALRAAPTEVPVLILGESGTGKERLARALHDASARREGPFVAVACSGLTESLFASEMFGHEKGAFTGAHTRTDGLVASASGGTLFLDEIGDIPSPLQVKLLRLLEARSYRRVGSARDEVADVRVVSATWRDLDKLIEDGQFRPDLYFRIATFPIRLPPLRDRIADLDLLVEAIMTEVGAVARPTAAAMAQLRAHPWPGNVRELRNVLQRAAILAGGEQVDLAHLALEPARIGAEPSVPPWGADVCTLDEVESRYLAWCLSQIPEDRAELAHKLGISERTLYRKLSRLKR